MLRGILSALAVICISNSANAELNRTFTYRVEPVVTDTFNVGATFDFTYSLAQDTPDPRGWQYKLVLEAKGYQDFSEQLSGVDQMVGEISAGGYHYGERTNPLGVQEQIYILSLLEKDLAGNADGISLTASEKTYLAKFIKQTLGNHTYFALKARYRYETTKNMNTKQNAVGVGAILEIPYLGELLDTPVKITRNKTDGFLAEPVRAYVGFDYVKGIGTLEGVDAETPRGTLEVAWGSKVVDKIAARVTYSANYLFDPVANTATNKYNGFLDAGLILPVSPKIGMVLKFVKGRVAPLYEEVSTGMLGLNLYSM